MASKQVVQRQILTGTLRTAVTAWNEEVTPALHRKVEPFLDGGEAELDFSRLQAVLGRMIGASLEEMIEADKVHLDELADDGALRTRRDDAVMALRRKLIEIRAITVGLFGTRRSREIVAVRCRVASQPDLLWRQGEHTLTRLRDPGLSLPEATTAAVRFDARPLADELAPLVADLGRAVGAVEGERRGAEVTLAVKRQAMAAHDQLMSACGRILSGLHLLAGRPDLARRIRVTVPRRKSGAVPSTPIPASSPPRPVDLAPGSGGDQAQPVAISRPTSVTGLLSTAPAERDANVAGRIAAELAPATGHAAADLAGLKDRGG